jgi:hypothetical protein
MGPKWKKASQSGGGTVNPDDSTSESTPETEPEEDQDSESETQKQNCGDCRNTSQWDGATPEE